MILVSAYTRVRLKHAAMSGGRHIVTTASVCDVSERSQGSGEKSECVCCDTLYRCCFAGNGDAEECCAVLMSVVRRDV